LRPKGSQTRYLAVTRGQPKMGTNLTDAQLLGAHLKGAFLEGAMLAGARLVDADLTDADLTFAFFEAADFTRVRWARTAQVPEGWEPDADSGQLVGGEY